LCTFPGFTLLGQTKEYRTRILAWFLVAIPASSVFGGPLSGVFLGMDGVGGLAGWKWLFLLEGLPTILLGIIFPWVLTNPAATVLHEIRSD